MVIWITGLSGAGKTTISQALVHVLRARGLVPVRLDGDALRAVFQDANVGYDRESRLKNAWRMSRMAMLIAAQDVPVIVATMPLFHEIHTWNRANLSGYFEVLVHAELSALQSRDPRGLYQRALGGLEPHVAGVDQEFELPESPDLVLDNTHHLRSPRELADEILACVDRSRHT